MKKNNYSSTALPSTKTIADIYTRIKNESLVLRPDFQRRLVWNDKHKINFIDTILKRFPFPEVYIANDETDTTNIVSNEIVVDGQQRLTTIVEYIDGTLKIPKDYPMSIFNELKEGDKKEFLNYPVTIRHLVGMDQAEIKEVFRRINQTQYALNSFEVNHAVYDGEFMRIAKEISELEDFKSIPTFSEKDFSRMADLGFVLLIMATVEHDGYFTYDKEVEKYIKEFDDYYPNAGHALKSFKTLFKTINQLGLKADSIWFRKSNLFTLFIESLRLGGVPDVIKLNKFEEFIENVRRGQYNSDHRSDIFAQYYSYMFTGTNSRQARTTRGEIFRKFMQENE